MADSVQPQETRGQRFMRSAGEVREDPDNKLWGPAKWVVQLIQYLVAMLMLMIGESLKSIFTGESKRKRDEKAE